MRVRKKKKKKRLLGVGMHDDNLDILVCQIRSWYELVDAQSSEFSMEC